MTPPYIATKRQNDNTYPWRPMDNRERRAAWAAQYYLLYQSYTHPTSEIEKHGTG